MTRALLRVALFTLTAAGVGCAGGDESGTGKRDAAGTGGTAGANPHAGHAGGNTGTTPSDAAVNPGAGGAGGTAGAGGSGGASTGGSGGTSSTGGHGGAHEGGGSMDAAAGSLSDTKPAADAGTPPDGSAAGDKVQFTLAPTKTNKVTGTATFTIDKGQPMLMVELKNCPAGRHPIQIHALPSCANDGEASGGHWGRGDGIGDVVCQSDGTGTLHAVKAPGYWTIGGPSVSNVLGHALIVHTGNDRIACGVISR